MSFFNPQNPGIGGLKELTDAELLFLTQFAGLTFQNGDILYYDNGQLRRLPVGLNGQQLQVNSALPSWQTPSSVPFFELNFTIGDWVLNGSNWELDVPHNLNSISTIVEVRENDFIVYVNHVETTTLNNIKLSVPDDPDLRFNGKVKVLT